MITKARVGRHEGTFRDHQIVAASVGRTGGILPSTRAVGWPGRCAAPSSAPPGDTVACMSRTSGEGPLAAREQPDEQPGSPERRSRTRHRSFLRELPVIVLTALVISLLIKTFLIQAFFIPSGSMEPTLHGCPGCLGDRVLVSKLFGHTGRIHRGDIVVFRDSSGWLPEATHASGPRSLLRDGLTFVGLAPSSTESDLIKRVIGLGGDTVEGRAGKVY